MQRTPIRRLRFPVALCVYLSLGCGSSPTPVRVAPHLVAPASPAPAPTAESVTSSAPQPTEPRAALILQHTDGAPHGDWRVTNHTPWVVETSIPQFERRDIDGSWFPFPTTDCHRGLEGIRLEPGQRGTVHELVGALRSVGVGLPSGRFRVTVEYQTASATPGEWQRSSAEFDVIGLDAHQTAALMATLDDPRLEDCHYNRASIAISLLGVSPTDELLRLLQLRRLTSSQWDWILSEARTLRLHRLVAAAAISPVDDISVAGLSSLSLGISGQDAAVRQVLARPRALSDRAVHALYSLMMAAEDLSLAEALLDRLTSTDDAERIALSRLFVSEFSRRHYNDDPTLPFLRRLAPVAARAFDSAASTTVSPPVTARLRDAANYVHRHADGRPQAHPRIPLGGLSEEGLDDRPASGFVRESPLCDDLEASMATLEATSRSPLRLVVSDGH